MNILILTPDGVGSTILQRLITMTLYLEKVPVINTHELTNGLILKNHIATKNFDLKYEQTLDQIIDILKQSSKDIQLVSRVAKYHLDARQDEIGQQEKFFAFLNKFYNKKIICLRKNVFEYAMSWSIREKTNILNVYNKEQKIIVNQVQEVDEKFFIKKCKEYIEYVNWAERYFNDAGKVFYEDVINETDTILQKITSFEKTFKKKLSIDLASIIKIEHKYTQHLFLGKKLNNISRQELQALVKYRDISKQMIKKEIMLNVPIKNTTLADKKTQIKNFNACLEKFYLLAKNHNWIDQSLATYDFWEGKHIC